MTLIFPLLVFQEAFGDIHDIMHVSENSTILYDDLYGMNLKDIKLLFYSNVILDPSYTSWRDPFMKFISNPKFTSLETSDDAIIQQMETLQSVNQSVIFAAKTQNIERFMKLVFENIYILQIKHYWTIQ